VPRAESMQRSAPREAGAKSGAHPRLVLKKNQDRRVRGGHPWVFSNEVGEIVGEPADGGLVEIADFRGAFLGRAYFNHKSLICARILTRGRDEIDRDFFVKRIERALRLRERALPGERTLRIVYGEADQLPGLVVDRYGDVLAVQVLTLGMEALADPVRAALDAVLAPRGVMRMADSPLRSLEGLPLERGVWWGEVPERIEVELEGFKVEADLHGGQKTGLFLDQRMNRRRAESLARDRRVLDLFCYQGGWSLHAARGGARSVLAVDSSEPALAAAARNLERNGLGERVTLRRGDAFDVARQLERTGERYGLVVLDPPALIKSRRHLAAGAKAYRDLNRAAMAMLEEDGVLITCSCSHHLDDVLFRQVLQEAARAAHRPFRVLEWAAESPDHPQLLAVPETHYLKCAVLQAI
jgi:23S rRNA (cytosine1962-C5)-methyltransferase